MANLTPDSVRQLLTMLDITRRATKQGIPLTQAYQDAVRQVSKQYDLRYQTIGDFRRRLGFHDVRQYMMQMEQWVHGDPNPLRRTIEAHADISARDLLQPFFDDSVLPQADRSPEDARRQPVSQSAALRTQAEQTPFEELRLRLNPDLAKRIQLANLAKIGPTIEETATLLLERGFEAEKERIRQFLAGL